MRRDRRAELGEMGITAGMVAMPVGVDDETGRIAARNLDDCAFDQAAGIGQLVIDHDDAVRAVQYGEISGHSGRQHVEAVTEIRALHRNLWLFVLRMGGDRQCGQ